MRVIIGSKTDNFFKEGKRKTIKIARYNSGIKPSQNKCRAGKDGLFAEKRRTYRR